MAVLVVPDVVCVAGFWFLIWFSSTIAIFGLLAGVVGSECVWWFWLMLGVGGCGVWWLSVGLWRSFYGRVVCGWVWVNVARFGV